jgi:coenzyme F420-reducing hydrogenase gamma subunit
MDTVQEQSLQIRKLKCAWFSFSCCEDNVIVFSELLNDHWLEWKKVIEITNARVLRTKNVMENFDIVFIEGAIASEKHIKRLKEVRGLAKKLVAVGACAITGMPSSQRNLFNEKQQAAIKELIDKFAALPKVLKVSEVVKVDAEVPGCPMNPDDFVAKTTALISELRGELAKETAGSV